MRCPSCKNKLLQKAGSHTRLRTEGVHEWDQDGVCRAKCYWCKALVEVPIQIQDGTDVPSERFVLGKGNSKT